MASKAILLDKLGDCDFDTLCDARDRLTNELELVTKELELRRTVAQEAQYRRTKEIQREQEEFAVGAFPVTDAERDDILSLTLTNQVAWFKARFDKPGFAEQYKRTAFSMTVPWLNGLKRLVKERTLSDSSSGTTEIEVF